MRSNPQFSHCGRDSARHRMRDWATIALLAATSGLAARADGPRFAGLEWNAWSTTPSPHSRRISSLAARTGIARRSTRARRG